MTPQQERQLGLALNDLILALDPQVREGPWMDRLRAAAAPLLEKVSGSGIANTFTVIDSDAFNAFSTPGGFIYVSRGLLDRIGEDEAYAIQFLVAHEMAHVQMRHALQFLRGSGLGATTGLGTVEALYAIVIPFAYPDEMDFEADRWALERMQELGHDRRECLAFLRKFESYAKAHHFTAGRAHPDLRVAPGDRPEPRIEGSLIDYHLRSHASVLERLKKAGAFLDSGPPPAR
jgi:predicted Zn-dependent protease